MPNFNYNVSHEGKLPIHHHPPIAESRELTRASRAGDYVVLASEPVCIVGVDIAAPGQSRRNNVFSLDEIFKSFRDQFTEVEWQNIRCFGDERSQENAFRRNWSCKVGPRTPRPFSIPLRPTCTDQIAMRRRPSRRPGATASDSSSAGASSSSKRLTKVSGRQRESRHGRTDKPIR